MGNLFKYITISVYPLHSNQTASIVLLVQFPLIIFIQLTVFDFSVKEKIKKPENNILPPLEGLISFPYLILENKVLSIDYFYS